MADYSAARADHLRPIFPAAKKTLHATEQNRPGIALARRGWKRAQRSLDPARLVFIDESAAETNMKRLRGRSPKGERLVCHAPHGHRRTTTMICSVRRDGTIAGMTIEGATNTEVFYAYIREVLVRSLRRGRHRHPGQSRRP